MGSERLQTFMSEPFLKAEPTRDEGHVTAVDWPSSPLRWMIGIAFALAWSIALLTPQPAQVATEVLSDSARFPTVKSLHILAYAAFIVLCGWQCVSERLRWCLFACVSFHAFATEFFQQYVPSRNGSLMDVGLDHIGIALGLAGLWLWQRRSLRT